MDTVTFFPRDITISKVGLDDFLSQAATYIGTIITAPPSTTPSRLNTGDPTRCALQNIAETLNRAEKLSNSPTPSPRVETPSKGHMNVTIATPTGNATLSRVQSHPTS